MTSIKDTATHRNLEDGRNNVSWELTWTPWKRTHVGGCKNFREIYLGGRRELPLPDVCGSWCSNTAGCTGFTAKYVLWHQRWLESWCVCDLLGHLQKRTQCMLGFLQNGYNNTNYDKHSTTTSRDIDNRDTTTLHNTTRESSICTKSSKRSSTKNTTTRRVFY